MPGEITQRRMTLEDLAGMMARGFAELTNDFSGRMTTMEKRLDKRIDDLESNMNARFDIVDNKIDRLEAVVFRVHENRIAKLEARFA